MIDLHHTLDTRPVLVAPVGQLAPSAASGTRSSGAGANGICSAYFGQVTYQTDSFKAANVDMGKTFRKGFQWYPWNWFSGVVAPEDRLALNSDGSITAVGTSGPNGQLVSGAQTNQAPYFVGKAFGGGLCVEAEVSFDPTKLDTTRGFPSFWALAFEHFNQRGGGAPAPNHTSDYEHFIELDFMEVYRRAFPEYLASAIDWYGQYRKTCAPNTFCKVAKSVDNIPGAIPGNTDWTQWHRVGAIWYPANGVRPGSVQYFFDGNHLGKQFVWHTPMDQSRDPTPDSDGLFSVTDRQHLILIFGSNSAPIRVRSVIVRQHDDTLNLTN